MVNINIAFLETRIFRQKHAFLSVNKVQIHRFAWKFAKMTKSTKNTSKMHQVRGLSGKFADTANKPRIVYHRLLKFCIKEYQVSGTVHTQYDWMFLNIAWFISF